MSDPVVGILGLICIIAVVVTLFRSKTQPAIAFIVFPAILGLILVLGGRYSFDNIATMIKSGLGSTGPTAVLFVFSVLYFGIMTDAGMFDVIIGKLMGLVGDNVIGVALVTAVIALALAHAALAGWQEKRRGAGLHGALAETGSASEAAQAQSAGANELARPKLFLFNILLTIAVIALLIWDVFPSYFPFMIGTAIALFVNYGFTAKMHKKIINLHAGPALMMCSTLMGAAVLMGVLTTSLGADGNAISAKVMDLPAGTIPSVVRCLAAIVSGILPAALGQHLPLVIGILSVPLALAFDTDSYFYGMLPVVIGIGQAFGVDALPIAVAMVVCRNCATFISPMVPATLLGTGLADVDIKDHIKASFLYVWGFSILCMLAAVAFGIMPL